MFDFVFLVKVVLEKILGLTTVNNNGLTMCPVTGFIAYPAGLVYVHVYFTGIAGCNTVNMYLVCNPFFTEQFDHWVAEHVSVSTGVVLASLLEGDHPVHSYSFSVYSCQRLFFVCLYVGAGGNLHGTF